MVSTGFDSVDEASRQSFESDWANNQARPIEEYLPSESNQKYLGTVEELIHIDLEFRWKRFGDLEIQSRDISAAPPSIEEYVNRFPRLQNPDVLSRLVQAEFELRSRHGESPSVNEYRSRFPDLVKSGVKLEDFLDEEIISVESVSQLKPGLNLGRYKLVAEQGRGGFGAVWRADDSKLGRRIALKRLSGHLARQSESRRRFVNEARVTAKLEHPGIVPIYDMGNLEEEHAYYTMRLVRGQTFEEAVASVHAIDRQEHSSKFTIGFRGLIDSLIDVCDTIEYCHAQGIIHRDLKPQNVISGDYGETIVLDWGLARRSEILRLKLDSVVVDESPDEDVEATKYGTVKGTPAYMSPEQASGQIDKIDQRSDIYSLGAMLYHVLANQAPFRGNLDDVIEMVKHGELGNPSELNASAPRPLVAACLKAMALRQDQRYQNVAEFADDLKRWQADEQVTAHRENLWEKSARWIRNHKTTSAIIVLSLFFAVVAVAVGNILWQQHQHRQAQRRASLDSLVESTRTEVAVEIASSRFASAQSILDQSYGLLENETDYAEDADTFLAQRERMSQINEFYKWSERAYEMTFLDQLDKSAIYSQAALSRIGALEHNDWWMHLPDQDLNPIQKDRLRTEVYRVFCTLAVMRAGQTLNDSFNLSVLMNPAKQKKENPNLAAADYAARRAEAFRPAECLRLVREFVDIAQGNRTSLPKMPNHPHNATDAGIMGSILDTYTPPKGMQRAALQLALGGRAPNDTARLWMTQATSGAPDWYWTSIFLAQSEMNAGNHELAIRSYSHSIGIKPNYWVGYLYRAMAYVAASQSASSESLKKQHLRAATLDIEKARELEPDKSELYWMAAYITSLDSRSQEQAARYYLRALWRHSKVSQLKRSHFSGVTHFLFGKAEDLANAGLKNDPDNRIYNKLKIATLHWKGLDQQAQQLIDKRSDDFENDQEVQAIAVMVKIQLGKLNDRHVYRHLAESIDESHLWLALAEDVWRHDPKFTAAVKYAQKSLDAAHDDRQRAFTLIKLANFQLSEDQIKQAENSFERAVETDLAVSYPKFEKAVAGRKLMDIQKRIDEHKKLVASITGTEKDQIRLNSPALINGDFELGISAYWNSPESSEEYSTWGNVGKRQTVAEAIEYTHRGKILHVQTNGTADSGYGATVQTFPVNKGQRYLLSFWCKGESLDTKGLQLIATSGKQQTTANSKLGTFDWQEFSGEFIADETFANLEIRFESNGQVWIDDIRVEAVQD